MPMTGSKISVHYIGTFVDGKKFDSSRDRGDTFDFALGRGQVIKGYDVGVATMALGERSFLIISPQWAYGDNGFPPVIPGGSMLVFDIEIIKIEDP